MSLKKKLIYISILLVLLTSCGFKKIIQDTADINLRNINITGETRAAYMLKNSILLISEKNLQSEKQYDIDVELTQTIIDKIKDKTGKTTRYSLVSDANLKLKKINDGEILQKKFSTSSNYDVGTNHSDTITRRKTAAGNSIKLLTEEITNFIILFSKN